MSGRTGSSSARTQAMPRTSPCATVSGTGSSRRSRRSSVGRPDRDPYARRGSRRSTRPGRRSRSGSCRGAARDSGWRRCGRCRRRSGTGCSFLAARVGGAGLWSRGGRGVAAVLLSDDRPRKRTSPVDSMCGDGRGSFLSRIRRDPELFAQRRGHFSMGRPMTCSSIPRCAR